jgi:hypothetical protein
VMGISVSDREELLDLLSRLAAERDRKRIDEVS